MVEISYLNNGTLGTATGTTVLAGVPTTGTSGIPGTLYSVSQIFSAGLEAQSSIGTTAVASGDLLPLSHGGSVYLASVSEVLSAGTLSLAVSSGGTTVSAVGSMVFSGATVSGSGGTATVAVAGVPPNAALLASNSGATATAVTLGANLVSAGGTLSVSVPVSEPLLGSSSSGSFSGVAIGTGLTLTANTLSATSAGGALTLTDGTHTVASVTTLTASGGTVSGTSPNATLTISGGGGGGSVPLTYTRPRLSAMTVYDPLTYPVTVTEPYSAAGPIKISLSYTSAGASAYICGVGQSLSSDTEVQLTAFIIGANFWNGAQYVKNGVAFLTSTGSLYTFHLNSPGSASGGFTYESDIFTNYYTFSSDIFRDTTYPYNGQNFWVRLHYVQSTGVLTYLLSGDGVSWSFFYQTTLSGTPTMSSALAIVDPNDTTIRIEMSLYHWDIAYGTGSSLNMFAPCNPL